MSGKYLIRSKGSTQLVDSLDGYPRAKVLAENVPDPPHADCEFVDGAWRDLPPPPPPVEERLAALEAVVEQLRSAPNAG